MEREGGGGYSFTRGTQPRLPMETTAAAGLFPRIPQGSASSLGVDGGNGDALKKSTYWATVDPRTAGTEAAQ